MTTHIYRQKNWTVTRSSRMHNITRPRAIIRGPGAMTLQKYFESNTHIIYGTISPIISTFVISMNVLLIATLIKGKFRMSTHVMMISIAIADSLTGLVPLPFNVYMFGLKKETDYLALAWCYVHAYMQKMLPVILHISSLHLTIGLAVERFIVVSFPLKSKRICTIRNGIIFSIVIFTISTCSQIDLFTQVSFEAFAVTSRRNSNHTIIGCLRSAKVRSDTEYIVRVAFLVFLPCLILIIFTILLLRKSKEIQQWRKTNMAFSIQKSTSVQSLERIDFAVILIMLFVVISEVAVSTSIALSRVNRIRFTRSHEELIGIGHIIFQITSPLNFVVLCFLSSKFRAVLKDMCSCFYRKDCCVCYTFCKCHKYEYCQENTSEKSKDHRSNTEDTPLWNNIIDSMQSSVLW